MRTQLLLTVSAMLLALICIAGIANALPQLVVDAPDTSIFGQQIEVTVTAEGKPIEEATVFFSLGGSQFQRRTDINSTATFTPTIAGNLSVIAVKQGYASSEVVTVLITLDEEQPLTTVSPTATSPIPPSPSQSPITTTPTSMPGPSGATPTPTPSLTSTPLSTPSASTIPSPTPEEPGFEAVFAIAGLLAVAYRVLRRKRK